MNDLALGIFIGAAIGAVVSLPLQIWSDQIFEVIEGAIADFRNLWAR